MKTPPINTLLGDMFPDAMRARQVTARDARGTATAWGSWITLPEVKAMGDGETKFEKDGVEVTAGVKVLVNGWFALTTDWEYELPSRFANRYPVAIHVDTSPDENGPHHQRVFFP